MSEAENETQEPDVTEEVVDGGNEGDEGTEGTETADEGSAATEE